MSFSTMTFHGRCLLLFALRAQHAMCIERRGKPHATPASPDTPLITSGGASRMQFLDTQAAGDATAWDSDSSQLQPMGSAQMQYLVGASAFAIVLLWMGLAKLFAGNDEARLGGLNSDKTLRLKVPGPPIWLPIVVMLALAVLSLNQMETAQQLAKSAQLYVAKREAVAHKLQENARLAKQEVEVERLEIKKKVKEKTAMLEDALHRVGQKELKAEEMAKVADQDSKKAFEKAAKAEKALKEAKDKEEAADDIEAEMEMQQQDLLEAREAKMSAEKERRRLFLKEKEAQKQIKAAEDVLQRKSTGTALPELLETQGGLKVKPNTSVEQELYLQRWATNEALAAARKGMKGAEQSWRMVAEAEGRAKLSEEVKDQAVRRAEAAEKRADIAEAKVTAAESKHREAIQRISIANEKIATLAETQKRLAYQEAASKNLTSSLQEREAWMTKRMTDVEEREAKVKRQEEEIKITLQRATEKVQEAESQRKMASVKAKKAQKKISRKEAVLNKAADEVAGRLSFLQGLLVKGKGNSDGESSMEDIWDKVLDKDKDSSHKKSDLEDNDDDNG